MPWNWLKEAYALVMADRDEGYDPEAEHDNHDLSLEELRHLRRIMKADERARWFWATVRTFAMWLTAVSIAVVAVKNSIIEIFLNGGKH